MTLSVTFKIQIGQQVGCKYCVSVSCKHHAIKETIKNLHGKLSYLTFFI